MRFYDTHAHVYADEYGERTESLLASLAAQEILVNNVGTNASTSLACVDTARRFPASVRAVVGLHPHEAAHEKFDANFYADLARLSEAVGVGECGLDYSRDGVDAKLQLEVFRQHVEVARAARKPLVIHCRASAKSDDAYQDLLAEMRSQNGLPNFVVHSFTASPEICQKFLALGGYIAFNGILTFDRTGQLWSSVAACPLDRLLIETDAPYLAPVPFRGKQNEPSYVRYVAEKVGEIKKVSVEEAAEATMANGLRLFP